MKTLETDIILYCLLRRLWLTAEVPKSVDDKLLNLVMEAKERVEQSPYMGRTIILRAADKISFSKDFDCAKMVSTIQQEIAKYKEGQNA